MVLIMIYSNKHLKYSNGKVNKKDNYLAKKTNT